MKKALFAVWLACAAAANPCAAEDASPSPAATDLAQFKTADDLWGHIQQGLRKNPQEMGSLEAAIESFAQTQRALADFAARFPSDPRIWQAKVMNAQFSAALLQMGRENGLSWEKIEADLGDVIADPQAPAKAVRAARLVLLARLSMIAPVEKYEKALESYERDYPDAPLPPQFKVLLAQKLSATNPEKAKKLMEESAKSSAAGMPAASPSPPPAK